MQASDAHALMAVMHGEWRHGEWLDDGGELTTRGTMFALVLADYAAETGAEAIARLRVRYPYREGPQTADLKAALREVAHEQALGRPQLPSHMDEDCCIGKPFAHFYQVHADAEMKARVDALLQIPKQRGKDTVVREAFAKMAAGNL